MLLMIVAPPNTSSFPPPKEGKGGEKQKRKRKGKTIIQKELRPIAPYSKGQPPIAVFAGNSWANDTTNIQLQH